MRIIANNPKPAKLLAPSRQGSGHPRILVDWRHLSDRFRSVRGVGVGYKTIQGWQAMGMPYLRQGRLIFYKWDACWEWYVDRFTLGQAV